MPHINEKVFPTVMAAISLCAALAYIARGDWRKVIYWLAACAITTVVTW